jgi:hypothetical protein
MRRITIMSGPIKFRIVAITGVISIFRLTAYCSSLIHTNLTVLYSQRVMCGVVWVADICEMASSSRFFCENGIKRDHVSLIRQMATNTTAVSDRR